MLEEGNMYPNSKLFKSKIRSSKEQSGEIRAGKSEDWVGVSRVERIIAERSDCIKDK